MVRRKIGWHTDPNDANLLRHWNGREWSPRTRRNPFGPYVQNRIAKTLATVAVILFAVLVLITAYITIAYAASTGTDLGEAFLVSYKEITVKSFGLVFLPALLVGFALALNKLKQINSVVETVCYFILVFTLFTLLNTGDWFEYIRIFKEMTNK